MEKMTIEELMKEYIMLRQRLDAAEAVIQERFTFRAKAEGKIAGLEAIEGALRSVVDAQKARITDITKEVEQNYNLVSSRLRKMPDFMIVSITERGNLEVCGECPTPRDLHRHSGYYFDHPGISKVALYAKIEFPYEDDDDTMAVMRPEPLETERKGVRMAEEKTEETREEKPELTSEKSSFDISKSRGSGENTEEATEKPITVEAGDQRKVDHPSAFPEEPVTIEIGEIDPGAGVPDDWVKHLETYTAVMVECYDRALTVCVLPEIAGEMALAMYKTIAGGQNAAYREFLDGLQQYLEKLNEPPPKLEVPHLLRPGDPFGPPFGFEVTAFPGYAKPTGDRQHEGVEYCKYAVLTEYPNGDHHASFYHEGFGPPDAGKQQAMKVYRECRDHPSVRKAYLLMNISDQVPAEDDIEKGAHIAPVAPGAEKTEEAFTDEKSEGEGT